MQLSTTYRNEFVDKEVPVNPAARPLKGGDVLPTGALDTSTTYGGDFKLFASARQAPVRPTNSMSAEKLPFAGASTYQDQYIAKVRKHSIIAKVRNDYASNKCYHISSLLLLLKFFCLLTCI